MSQQHVAATCCSDVSPSVSRPLSDEMQMIERRLIFSNARGENQQTTINKQPQNKRRTIAPTCTGKFDRRVLLPFP